MPQARFTDSRLLAAALAVVVSLWTGTLAGQGWAAEEDPAEDTTDDPIVVADILVEDEHPDSSILFLDPTATFERIDVADLRDQVQDLADLLDRAVGLRVTSFGGVGRTATVSIRGSTGAQVLVLLDGVPLNVAGEAVDLSTIPLDSLLAVEIFRGSASALYGAQAVGGVINLISRPAEGTSRRDTAGSLRLGIGTESTTSLALQGRHSRTHDETRWQFTQEHTRGDFGFRNDNGTVFNTADDFADRRHNNEAHAGSAAWQRTWRNLPGQGTLTGALSGFWRTRGEPGVVTFPSDMSKLREARLVGDLTWRRNDWLWDDSTAEVKLYARELAGVFQDPLGEQTGAPLSTQQRDLLIGLRLGTSWIEGPEMIWTALVEAQSETLRDSSPATQGEQPDRTRRTLGAALRAEWTWAEDWVVVGAIRGDALSDQPGHISPRLGLRWTPDPAWTLTASAGNSYRPPSFSELSENRGFVVGNPDLRPEVARTLDVGMAYEGKQWSAGATIFQTDTRDLIEYVQIASFRFRPLNFGRTRARGIETTGTWTPHPAWTLSADWTWQGVTDQTGGANRQGQRIPGRPDQFGNVELRWREGAWSSGLHLAVVGSNALTFANTKELPARESLDWNLGYRQGPDAWNLLVANLADAAFADLRGFPLPGRTCTLTYTRSW